MGKIRKTGIHSLKWSFLKYIPVCLILAWLGAMAIGIGTNNLQDWYRHKYPKADSRRVTAYEIRKSVDETLSFYSKENVGVQLESFRQRLVYGIISYAQVLLVPLWVFLCVGGTGVFYYKREMEKSITALQEASDKISKNYLDFHLEPGKPNELSQLCGSFEKMREALYRNNQETWRMLEERKRLNAAFSHDIRTPITVLKGYADLLGKYIPDGRISEEKLMGILEMMSGQITRLEDYTRKMSAVHKLEDLEMEIRPVSVNELSEKLRGISSVLAPSRKVDYTCESDRENVFIDEGMILEVYENLVSNAVRYAELMVKITVKVKGDRLEISVEDDGNGFTRDALKCAADPFFRDEKDKDKVHFGLGLYISRIICEKLQGDLIIENGTMGGKVTANFEGITKE